MCCFWALRLCADGRRRTEMWLCFPCDRELNRMVMRFAGVDGWRAKTDAYTWAGLERV